MKKRRILLGLGAFAFLGLALTSCDDFNKMYQVTFYSGTEKLDTKEVKYGYNVAVPEMPKEDGKIFNGWYKDAELTEEFNFGDIITGNVSIYARWLNEFTVTFKNGDETLKSETVINGQVVSKPENPTQANKVFKGWYSDSDFSVEYNFEAPITANTTLFAKWENEYVVTFKNGEENIYSQNVQQGVKVEQIEAPAKERKVFAGWFKDAEFTESFNFDEVISTDTVIYAKYENIYAVTFKNGEEVIEAKDVKQGLTVAKPENPTKEGFVFVGWYSDAAYENLFDFTTIINGDLSLYAKFNEVVTPENPDTPETPENPDTPVTPETPENPENPDTPVTPETPENPDTPETPDTPVVTTFKLSFVSEHGTKPADKEAVDSITEEDLAPLTDDDYNFLGWYVDEALTTSAEATTISKGTTLYAKWVKKSLYEKMSVRDDVVLASNFDSETTIAEDYAAGKKGFFNANVKEGCTVAVTDGKIVLTDTSDKESTTSVVGTGFLFDGKVESSFKYTPVNADKKLNTKWSMISIIGFGSASTGETEIFAIRTNEDKNSENKSEPKIQIYVNGTYQGEKVSYEPNKEYEIYWSYDFAANKLTVKINGTVVVEDFEIPAEKKPVVLTGVKFVTAGSDTLRGAKVDDFVLNQSNVSTVDEFKQELITISENLVNKYLNDENYFFVKPELEKVYSGYTKAMSALETKEAVFEYQITSLKYIFNLKSNNEKKADAKTDLNDLKELGINNFTGDENRAAYEKLFEDACKAIDEANSIEEIKQINLNVRQTIPTIKNDIVLRMELVDIIRDYYNSVHANLSKTISASEYSAAKTELDVVYDKYNKYNQENEEYEGLLWSSSVNDLKKLEASFKEEIDAIAKKYSFSLEDYEKELDTKFEEFKKSELEKANFPEADITPSVVSSMKIDWTNVTTKEEALKAYEDNCKAISDLIELSLYQNAAIDELKAYISEQEATLLMKDYEKSSYKEEMDKALYDYFEESLPWTKSIDETDAVLAEAKKIVDKIIVNIKDATEATVKFFDGETELTDLAATIVKGSKVTKPTDPTKDGVVFKGWFTDDTLSTDFDFDANISTSTNVYAGWYEIVKTSIDFASLKKSDGGKDVTANFKTSEEFTVKDSKDNDFTFTISASSGNMQVSSNGLKVQKKDNHLDFTTSESSTMTLAFKLGDGRTVNIYCGTTLIAKITKDKNNGKTSSFNVDASKEIEVELVSKSDNCTIEIKNAPAGAYSLVNGGDYTINFVSVSIETLK